MTVTVQNLINFLRVSLNIDDQIDENTQLFSSGLLDSVAMMNVIGFVEEAAPMEVHSRDVTLENFGSVRRIVEYAERQH